MSLSIKARYFSFPSKAPNDEEEEPSSFFGMNTTSSAEVEVESAAAGEGGVGGLMLEEVDADPRSGVKDPKNAMVSVVIIWEQNQFYEVYLEGW